MAYSFKIRKVYSFDVYPIAILGNDYKNVTVTGIVDYEAASRIMDVSAVHIQVYNNLPSGTPNNPKDYDYLVIKTPTGATTVVGMAWIKEDTVQERNVNVINVKISGSVSVSDIPRIRSALVQNGFDSIEITTD